MKTIRLLSFMLLFSCMQMFAQQDSAYQKLYSFVENINAFTNYYPQEKVYLHFDNSSYFLGETIWFKCYVSVADKNKATDISRTLYVELLTPEGQVVENRKLLVKDGQCHGDFFLSDKSLYSGFYQVRAYTRYMLNFGEDCIFSRVFPVYDKPKKQGEYNKMNITGSSLTVPDKRKSKAKLKKVNIDFFPEGGNLVQGIESKVAFKITDENGMGIDVAGTVYSEQKEAVATFESVWKGMGCFNLLPDGKDYYAEITYEGKNYKEKLPLVENEGYVMRLDNISDEEALIVGLQRNGAMPQKVAITASCRGIVNSFAMIDLKDKNKAQLKLPFSDMETGVNEITLYDTEGRIWSDRLSFVNHNDKQLYIVKKQDRNQYKPLGKVSMDFEITDADGQPVETGFSLSVRDAGTTVSTTYDDNVMTNLLLSSDLKGYIENPRYYFENNDDKSKSDLDLLMLTQGWRRYVWKQMAGLEKLHPTHPAEKGILINGVIKSLIRNKTMKDIDITILLRNDSLGVVYEAAKTNEQGYFGLYTRDVKGVWEVVLQTKEKDKKKDYRIMLDRLFSPAPLAYTGYETQLTSRREFHERRIIEGENQDDTPEIEKDTTVLTMETRDHLLPTVTITEKRKTNEKAEDLKAADIIYNVEKEIDSIEDKGEFVGDNVADFLMKTNENFIGYNDYNGRKYYYLTHPVVFIVDGKLLNKSRWSDIDDIPLNQVDTIALLGSWTTANRFMSEKMMDDSFNGPTPLETFESDTEAQTNSNTSEYKNGKLEENIYILLYTYTDGHYRPDRKSIRKTAIQGYSYTREFYNPQYETIFADDVDYRRTLYWNPNVKTGKDGKASVSFYNNSTSSQFMIDAETLLPAGLFGVYAE
ncbi:MAG: hypothetical protein LBS20_09645 [Prevotella sp.]|jgi:hypothetical protein|nr:hypothetical protein [Prevotella sp.]